MSLYDDFQKALDEIIAKYKEANSDGQLTFQEIFALVSNAVAMLVQLAERYGGYSGAERKEAVLEALGRFYDEVIEPIDIKHIPNFIESVVDRALKQLILTLADPLIDSLVNLFNRTGWGGPNGGGAIPSDPAGDAPDDFEPY